MGSYSNMAFRIFKMSIFRPVNLVLVDYAGSGSVRVADVVKRMNDYNVKMKDTFKTDRVG